MKPISKMGIIAVSLAVVLLYAFSAYAEEEYDEREYGSRSYEQEEHENQNDNEEDEYAYEAEYEREDSSLGNRQDDAHSESEKKLEEENSPTFSDFIDTMVNFTLADDNLLDNSEFSPAMRVGASADNSEFLPDQIDRHDINRTYLALHHKSNGYIDGLITEAALVLGLRLSTDPMSGEVNSGLSDGSSFVRVGYDFDKSEKGEMILDFTGFPYDAESFLMGYHHNLTWGGKASFPQNRNPIPGFRLGFDHQFFYAFLGMKTALLPKKDKLNTERVPVETTYSVFGGFGIRAVKGLLIEANGGAIQKGDNPNMPEVKGDEKRDDIWAGGVSARISYASGMKIGQRIDLGLRQNDPRKRLQFARRDKYKKGKFSYMVSGETTFLTQNLQDPDPNRYGATKSMHAPAALLAAKFKYSYFRTHIEFGYRSLEFLIFDTPGFVPFQALPKGAQTNPEIYGLISLDYHIKPAYMTIALMGGYKKPATYKGTPDSPVSVVKRRTASSAFLSPFDRTIEPLPAGKNAYDIVEAKLDIQFDLSDFMTFMLELSYALDNNRSKLETDPNNSDLLIKKFEDPKITNRVGLAAVLQAKF